MTPIRYTLSDQDYIAAYRIWRRHQFLRMRQVFAVPLIVVAVTILIGAATQSGAWAVVSCLGSVGYFVWVFARMPYASLRRFRASKTSSLAIVLRLEPDGIAMVTDVSTVRQTWANFIGWMQGPEAILLMHTETLYNPIPRRVLTPENQALLIGCLATARIPERQSRRLRW